MLSKIQQYVYGRGNVKEESLIYWGVGTRKRIGEKNTVLISIAVNNIELATISFKCSKQRMELFLFPFGHE